ncbi:MAG: MBL fold metallo-hydrolase [Clostridia bacterium]|nr:MBL fold metallo-hydrolase [Clostridia bacterium]
MVLKLCASPSNSYLCWNNDPAEDGLHEAVLIECACLPEWVRRVCRERGLRLKYIFLTHGHYDHTLTYPEMREEFPEAVTVCHRDENAALTDIEANGSELFGNPTVYEPCEMTVTEGSVLKLHGAASDMELKVISTPGHTPGSVCLWCEEEGFMFTGDTVFADGGIGRTDLKGGNYSGIVSSLARLAGYPGETVIFPGHGAPSLIEREF